LAGWGNVLQIFVEEVFDYCLEGLVQALLDLSRKGFAVFGVF
jgi:hypothetical protein